MTSPATDVFLSYKAEDRPRLVPLVKALEAEGFTVWWDAHIGGGTNWHQDIEQHLEAAKCVIVSWSKRSVGRDGQFVRDEARRAQRREAYIPVCLDAVEPPLGFGEIQALPLKGWKGERSDPRFQAVATAVRSHVAGLHLPHAERHSPRPRVTRRTMLIAGSGAGLLAVGGGATFAWKQGWFGGGGAAQNSIAVLPFANLSGDSNQRYFSDGIAEELRSVLSRIPGLQVVARTSSEAVRDADAQAAAAKLHVSNILTGSVRRSPQLIRIGAQLIDGSSGTERWSEVYDRPVGDMLQIQSEIATMVAQSLSIHLEGAQQRALKEGGTQNPVAQDLLLQAQGVMWRNDDPASLRRASGYVDGALALDPRYADAIAAKAALTNAMGSFFASSAEDGQRKSSAAAKLARDAIAIAPKSGMARAVLASTLWNSLKLRDGLAEFQEAAKLTGGSLSFFNGFDLHALALVCCRRFDAAVARSEHFVATDPLNPNALLTKGVVLVHSRRYGDAYDAMGQAMALGPQLSWPRAFQGLCLMQEGKLEEARKLFDEIPGTGPWLSYAAALAWRQNRTDDADRLLALMRNDMGDAGYYQYAEVFAQQSRKDEALRALEQGWNSRDPGLSFMNVDAMLDPVRADQRFQNIVSRLDFPSEA